MPKDFIISLKGREEDIDGMCARLRLGDRMELLASFGGPSKVALTHSLEQSDEAFTVFLNGKPAVMWGVRRDARPDVGIIWMVGSEDIEKRPMLFVKQAAARIKRLKKKYALLTNWVDARNVVHIRWLDFVGARFTNIGYINGLAFLKFEIKGDLAQCAA